MNETARPISNGAEAELGHVYKLHTHGEVELVDYLGTDSSIASAARTSYQKSEGKTAEADRKLINRLWHDRHTSPFEMVNLTFRIRLPIFVMRQHVRHRTASLNEWSFRYTKCPELFFSPSENNVRTQSKTNKQMSGDALPVETSKKAINLIEAINKKAYETYQDLLDMEVSREQARIVLPVSAYTQIVWSIDMRNLLHYFSLRLAEDAQPEIQDYARIMSDIVRKGWPMIWDAYSSPR